jgi:hypothetical protein
LREKSRGYENNSLTGRHRDGENRGKNDAIVYWEILAGEIPLVIYILPKNGKVLLSISRNMYMKKTRWYLE